ncbi:hypothetical protein R6V09_09500 [Streptomyces sp. W16]|uniref:hypothetical protein n=1 Tax=Streptomyces sp. W16 TaxID=3076631 RepID=UPI00295A70CD|nr:hypothetical protein [Streptomyces sp. W16]MDV9170372.1 hypothetical protein [Streptomyces sp. W16]
MPTTGISPTVAPAWLRHVAAGLHEQLPTDVRDDWTARLYDLVDEVPDTGGLFAVHVWHAETILPLLAEAAQDGDVPLFAAPRHLHRAAARGRTSDQDTWRTALTPMLLHLYDAAYDRTGAYTEAHTGARDYALANGFSATEADGYGHEYAQLSSDANARACAEAHAQALGPALARAYATDGCEAFADTFPAAQLRAVVRVTTGRGDPFPATRLAEGLISALESGQLSDRGR